MASMPGDQVDRDVLLIVGGSFTPDALGPEYERVLARVRGAPDAHLDAFERLFLRARMDARAHSRFHLPGLLRLLADRAPDRVRSLAARLVAQYDTAMSITDDIGEGAAVLEALPEDSRRVVQRLDRRRNELRAILGRGRSPAR